MATSYPNGKDTFITHVDTNETVKANDINKIQDAVKAIEDELGTNAKGSKADVKTRIADVETTANNALPKADDKGSHIFRNLCGYTIDNNTTQGALVIDTGIPFNTSAMFRIQLAGYIQGNNSHFDMTIGGYGWYGGSQFQYLGFINPTRYTYTVKAARNIATGNIAFIIGDVTTIFPYVKMAVTEAVLGFGTRNLSHANNWSLTQKTNISGYDLITTASDVGIYADKAGLSQKTATLPNTQGWYRIATSVLNIAKNSGIFAIELNGSGVQNSIILSAGCNFGITNATTIQQLLYDAYTTNGITKARIVYHTTYTGNYAYLEVYLNGNTGGTITIRGIELKGWTLLNDPSTAGSIPSGYITKELAFNGGLATTEKVLASGKEAWHGGNSNIRTYVRATVNAQQDISPSVYTKLNFNTEITDNLNEFNATTSRFTAIEKGSYFIAFSLYLYYTNLNIEFKILAYKNGTLDKIICSTTTKGGDALISGSGEVELNAGDNLELYIYSSNNANPYSVKFTTDSNLDISRMS